MTQANVFFLFAALFNCINPRYDMHNKYNYDPTTTR